MNTFPPTDFETLDPQDWETMRALMHQMVDDAVGYLANVRDREIWQQMPPEVMASFTGPVPTQPSSAESVYEELQSTVLPYNMGNVHPRFWAWYMGNGTISGVMGDFWASVMNPNVGGGNHAGIEVERQVLNWMKEIMGFPASASGLLVSGGSMANFSALTVARNVKAGYDIRQEGIRPEIAGKMIAYASGEVHSCNQKALELLGLGANSLHKIRVNPDYTINLEALANQIQEDRAKGLLPFCVIGTSGTVNTGAIDDLPALADLCEAENLWFHVDGAIGAVAVLAPNAKASLAGIERADSIAMDLHKWLHMPFEAGCVLIKDASAHKNAFSLIPEYLAKNTRGVASGENWPSEYGLQLSRRFRALKIWMSLKEHGTEKFGRMIARNIEQAQYLGRLIAMEPTLELLAPIGLDIVCFRYNPGGMDLAALNALNKEIKLQLEEQAIAVPGYTTLADAYCIRIAIANHRSTTEDFDVFLEELLRLGKLLNG
ncbi:MAG: pyridoxal-dependent decarboxylase [Bacteroidia bacterium]|nr:pyridoxal-dependent decarboxylase [Bacteroidia bacterium]